MPVVVASKRQVSRPLKVLIPLIQDELQQGNTAGRMHYTRAGEMLMEAREQVPRGSWGRWLNDNFELSRSTAYSYMQWAEALSRPSTQTPSSLNELRGGTDRRREERGSTQQQAFRKMMRDMPRDEFAKERQAREDEVQLHRDLAEELIDAGYRALATKLHPDRGGSKDAMRRLNVVRDELKEIAKVRRFV